MASRPTPSSSRQAYIPAAAQAAMSRQMQQSMPAHLQQYVGANKPTYVPQNVQRELTSHMQKVMPEHLKQYAGSYVEQNIVNRPVATAPMTGRPPTPDRWNQSHRGEIGSEQQNAQFLNLFQSDQAAAVNPQPTVSAQAPASNPSNPYDFIINPAQPSHKSPFSGNSMATRLLLVFGVVFLALIVLVGAKNLLGGSGSSNKTLLISTAQDQTELLHLSTGAAQNAVTENAKDLALTTQLSLTSEQSQLLAYMKRVGIKTNAKVLALKQNAAVDTQLTNAESSSTFDATYLEVMQTALTTYQKDLAGAYQATKGANGKALLSADYDAASLLVKQVTDSAN